MLLKIGKVYINTDHVLKWNVNSTNGGGSISAIDKDGDTIEVFHAEKTPPDVMMALVRWLDANATDIMATADPQPAPAKAEICEGDTVGIIGTKYFGEVLRIRALDGGRQYFLKRAYNLSEDQFLGWFTENMLDPENNVPDEYAAPVETPEPRKFRSGEKVWVVSKERSNLGTQVVVSGYNGDDYVEDTGGNSYRESELSDIPF